MPIPGYPAVHEPGVSPRRAPYFSGNVAQHRLGHWRAFRRPPVQARLCLMLLGRSIMAPSLLAALSVVASLTLMNTPAAAQGVADFYRGRTVSFVVGFGPGGGYDLYARVISRHIGRHIPGNPNVVVQNMDG